jgi:hypothetical protein
MHQKGDMNHTEHSQLFGPTIKKYIHPGDLTSRTFAPLLYKFARTLITFLKPKAHIFIFLKVSYFTPKWIFCFRVSEEFAENFISGFHFTNLQEGLEETHLSRASASSFRATWASLRSNAVLRCFPSLHSAAVVAVSFLGPSARGMV